MQIKLTEKMLEFYPMLLIEFYEFFSCLQFN